MTAGLTVTPARSDVLGCDSGANSVSPLLEVQVEPLLCPHVAGYGFDKIFYYRNKGGRSFASKIVVAPAANYGLQGIPSLAVADLNGDGLSDLVAAVSAIIVTVLRAGQCEGVICIRVRVVFSFPPTPGPPAGPSSLPHDHHDDSDSDSPDDPLGHWRCRTTTLET